MMILSMILRLLCGFEVYKFLHENIGIYRTKLFGNFSENDTSVDEYKIHNENGRVVITPVQEKKDENTSIRNRGALALASTSSSEIRDRTLSSASTSSNYSSESEFFSFF